MKKMTLDLLKKGQKPGESLQMSNWAEPRVCVLDIFELRSIKCILNSFKGTWIFQMKIIIINFIEPFGMFLGFQWLFVRFWFSVDRFFHFINWEVIYFYMMYLVLLIQIKQNLKGWSTLPFCCRWIEFIAIKKE